MVTECYGRCFGVHVLVPGVNVVLVGAIIVGLYYVGVVIDIVFVVVFDLLVC